MATDVAAGCSASGIFADGDHCRGMVEFAHQVLFWYKLSSLLLESVHGKTAMRSFLCPVFFIIAVLNFNLEIFHDGNIQRRPIML